MAATISANSAGGGGLVTSGDASGVLALQTAGVTALSISTAQVVSFTNPVALTSATLTTPTIDSAQVPTVSGTAPLYMCRAWVNFNGTGIVAIRASGNVSSITDNGTGDYTVNFTTAMPDANYSGNVQSGSYNGRTATIRNTSTYDVAASVLSSSLRVMIASNTATPNNEDLNTVCVSVFR